LNSPKEAAVRTAAASGFEDVSVAKVGRALLKDGAETASGVWSVFTEPTIAGVAAPRPKLKQKEQILQKNKNKI